MNVTFVITCSAVKGGSFITVSYRYVTVVAAAAATAIVSYRYVTVAAAAAATVN